MDLRIRIKAMHYDFNKTICVRYMIIGVHVNFQPSKVCLQHLKVHPQHKFAYFCPYWC